jgi:hypothetical protein
LRTKNTRGKKRHTLIFYFELLFLVSAAPGYAPIPFQQRPLQNGPIATPNGQQTHEMNIPNDLIGCIIGRGGQKINEIRYDPALNFYCTNY